MDSDFVARGRQLYLLLQPYAAALQAVLERLDHEKPFKALAEEDQAPKELASLGRNVSELPAGEMAALLDKVIAVDKSGEPDSLDLQHMRETFVKLEKQIRSLSKNIQSFAKKGVRIPVQLPQNLREALSVEAARLERDITAARARMIKEQDLRILREAKISADIIAAIVRDAPKQKDIDVLTKRLENIRSLMRDSAAAAKFAERRNALHIFATGARGSLRPLLDPLLVHQLIEFAQPILEHHKRLQPRE